MATGWKLCLLLAAMALLPVPDAGAEIIVTYPAPESSTDARSNYPLRLLELALARAGKGYRVVPSRMRMQQKRAIALLERHEIDAMYYMTSAEREQKLLPVRIPVDKGLIGMRLLLVNKDQAGRINGQTTLDELRKLRAGQGSDWPDMSILLANGLNVYGTTSYSTLFQMLEAGSIDYFPRGVSEVWKEADTHERLTVAPGIMLRYNTASYFFVRRDSAELAADIGAGLEKMIADGSFERLFREYFGSMIERSELKTRRVIELHNPLQPANLPLDRKNLWLR